MFEREIKFIYDFNLNKVNKLGPYFTFEQLSSSDLHPAILHYISSEIDYLVFEDRQKLLKNSVFDYSGEKINHLFVQIGEEVKRTKRFSLEYISKLILHASSFTINFLVRPKWTLIKFVFDEGEHKTTSEIKQILNYLYYYKHLKSILISYINTKKIISMNTEEFTALIDKVDGLGVETYLPNILSGSLKSMSEFFNIGEVQKTKIPLIAVQTFIEEKGLTRHLEKINSVFGEDTSAKFNISEFQKAFDSVMAVKVEDVEESKPEEIFEPVIVEQHDIETEDEIDKVEIKETEESLKAEVAEEEKSEPETEVPAIDKDDDKEDETLNIRTETQSDELPSEKKRTKIRINVKENNKIEKIEEDEKIDEPVEETKVEEDPDMNLFQNIEEDVVQDIVEEPEEEETIIVPVEVEEGKEDEFDRAAQNVDGIMEYKNDYDEYEKSEEENINEDDGKNILDELEKALPENEEEEKESMLKTILSGKDDDEEDEINPVKKIQHEEVVEGNGMRKMDLAELLEHKDMTKVIEVIFDYDIEEFSNTLEDIMDSEDYEDALDIINDALKQRGIGKRSREAELFKQIISEFFEKK